MPSVTGKTWIDMTDLSVWKGHMTGIQRVVYNVALYYHKEHKNVGYFLYDERAQTFYEFDFAALIDAIEAQAATDHIPTSNESRAKKLFHAIRNQVPRGIRARIGPQWKDRAKRAYLKGRNIYSTSRQKLTVNKLTAERRAVVFSKNDTVLILGNSWDRDTILRDLRAAKDHAHFKVVQLIYDLIPIYEPHSFNEELYEKYTRHMFEIIDLSDNLLAISESSKKDLLRFCKDVRLPEPEVNVIRLGDEIEVESQPTRPSEVPENTSFVLCVGTIEARKNHALLYYSWKLANQKGIKLPKLVIVGRPGWYTGDVLHYMALDAVTRDNFIVLQNVNDSQLTWLYQNCLFTVYPSSYEGWGLPIAESLAYGKVCIASNTSSMTEIAGGLLDYFSPFNTDECLTLIRKYMTNPVRSEKEKEIEQSYEITPWSKTAIQVENFLNNF